MHRRKIVEALCCKRRGTGKVGRVFTCLPNILDGYISNSDVIDFMTSSLLNKAHSQYFFAGYPPGCKLKYLED